MSDTEMMWWGGLVMAAETVAMLCFLYLFVTDIREYHGETWQRLGGFTFIDRVLSFVKLPFFIFSMRYRTLSGSGAVFFGNAFVLSTVLAFATSSLLGYKFDGREVAAFGIHVRYWCWFCF